MKMVSVAAMLLACAEGTELRADLLASFDADAHEEKLSQSFASAFQMASPKLMTTKQLPAAGKGACPAPGNSLTFSGSGGAFIDGCYMNTTRSQARDEATGEEAQKYLYMWKHACAFTKWVPSNQFMYSNLDYDASTMTLERFGFIGMDKRCFWGSIGVLWKRPLPVDQILPNNTNQVAGGPRLLQEGRLFNTVSEKGKGCLGVSTSEPGKLSVSICKKGADQSDIWQYMSDGMIINKATGDCVTIDKHQKGQRIKVAECTGSPLQTWSQFLTSEGKFKIESTSPGDGRICFDLPGATKGAQTLGQNVNVWSCPGGTNPGDNYEWTFL